MIFDQHKNFAYSTVATAPSPATSGTSLVVASGEGTRFPTPPFNATIWSTATQPLPTNAEIVRVTARSTDTLTIQRAQESTTARTIVAGDQIAASITAQTLADVEADPRSYMYETEDFVTAYPTNGQYGKLGWYGEQGSRGPIFTEANHPGIMRLSTGSTSGSFPWLSPGAPSLSTGSLRDADLFDLYAIVRIPIITACKVRFGLGPVATDDPYWGVTMEFNPAASANWRGIHRTAGGAGTAVDTGIAVVAGTWYRLRLRRTASGVAYSVNDGTEVENTAALPGQTMGVAFHIGNTAAADKQLDIDYFAMRVALTR